MTRNAQLILLIAFCLALPGTGLQAQDDPFLQIQSWMKLQLEQAWDTFWADCNRSTARPVKERGPATTYLTCVIGNLPDVVRTWTDVQNEGRATVLELIASQMQGYEPQQLQEMQSMAAFTFNRFKAWHRRQAGLVVTLSRLNFLVKDDAEELLESIQVSMDRTTALSRTFVEETGALREDSGDDIQPLREAFLEGLETTTHQLVDQMQNRMLHAITRSRQQFNRPLTRDSTDIEAYVNSYDAFFIGIFEALQTNLQLLWVEVQESEDTDFQQ